MPAAFQSVLEKDTEPHPAPDEQVSALKVKVCVAFPNCHT